MLVHRRVTPSIEFAGTHLYTWLERGTVRVKCFAQEHNTISPARPRTRTTRSGVERTNHEATAPPGAVSRRGICHIWFRGRHISPSMPYREARSVAESSEGPTASKSDRMGRNPGMTRLVRRSSATSGGTALFSLV